MFSDEQIQRYKRITYFSSGASLLIFIGIISFALYGVKMVTLYALILIFVGCILKLTDRSCLIKKDENDSFQVQEV
jgi:Ca2+/Na+ antiporter